MFSILINEIKKWVLNSLGNYFIFVQWLFGQMILDVQWFWIAPVIIIAIEENHKSRINGSFCKYSSEQLNKKNALFLSKKT